MQHCTITMYDDNSRSYATPSIHFLHMYSSRENMYVIGMIQCRDHENCLENSDALSCAVRSL